MGVAFLPDSPQKVSGVMQKCTSSPVLTLAKESRIFKFNIRMIDNTITFEMLHCSATFHSSSHLVLSGVNLFPVGCEVVSGLILHFLDCL